MHARVYSNMQYVYMYAFRTEHEPINRFILFAQEIPEVQIFNALQYINLKLGWQATLLLPHWAPSFVCFQHKL